MKISNRRNIPESFFIAVKAVFPKGDTNTRVKEFWTLCGGKSFIKLNAAAQYFNWESWEYMKTKSQLESEAPAYMSVLFIEVLEKYKDPNFTDIK